MKRILLLLISLVLALSVMSCGDGVEARESNGTTEKGSDAVINNITDTDGAEKAEDIVEGDCSESGEDDNYTPESDSKRPDIDLPKVEF